MKNCSNCYWNPQGVCENANWKDGTQIKDQTLPACGYLIYNLFNDLFNDKLNTPTSWIPMISPLTTEEPVMTIRTPYLIQRAEVKSPLATVSTRLSQAVVFDYMGSAEFEFGALPNSFRRLEANKGKLTLRMVPEIMEGEIPLRVYSYLTDEEFEQYKGYLETMRKPCGAPNQLFTKESVRFNVDYEHGKYSKTDFWWDINNDVMFGFNKMFMKKLESYVQASLDFMNEQKAKS